MWKVVRGCGLRARVLGRQHAHVRGIRQARAGTGAERDGAVVAAGEFEPRMSECLADGTVAGTRYVIHMEFDACVRGEIQGVRNQDTRNASRDDPA